MIRSSSGTAKSGRFLQRHRVDGETPYLTRAQRASWTIHIKHRYERKFSELNVKRTVNVYLSDPLYVTLWILAVRAFRAVSAFETGCPKRCVALRIGNTTFRHRAGYPAIVLNKSYMQSLIGSKKKLHDRKWLKTLLQQPLFTEKTVGPPLAFLMHEYVKFLLYVSPEISFDEFLEITDSPMPVDVMWLIYEALEPKDRRRIWRRIHGTPTTGEKTGDPELFNKVYAWSKTHYTSSRIEQSIGYNDLIYHHY